MTIYSFCGSRSRSEAGEDRRGERSAEDGSLRREDGDRRRSKEREEDRDAPPAKRVKDAPMLEVPAEMPEVLHVLRLISLVPSSLLRHVRCCTCSTCTPFSTDSCLLLCLSAAPAAFAPIIHRSRLLRCLRC